MSTSSTTNDRSSSLDPTIGLPPVGHVSRLKNNWSVFEDGALAQKLQNEEITSHLQDNRRKNIQIRDDFPRALEEQTKEQYQVDQWIEERRRHLKEQEKSDAEIARRIASELQNPHLLVEKSHLLSSAPYSVRQRQPIVPQPRGAVSSHLSSRSPSNTPPLPVMSDGDVPSIEEAKTNVPYDEDVLPHVRGGLRYNDDQYLVKLARPAVAIAEPVYANNRPEHYAVSAKFPQPHSETGAIAKTPRPLGPGSPGAPKATELLLGATGLSQRDLALSKRAEEQLEQERRDQELARRLQEQFDMEEPESERQKSHREEQDRLYAEVLQAKEEAKLRRAKERAKLKKMQRQHQQSEERPVSGGSGHRHERSTSQPVSLESSQGHLAARSDERTESRMSRRSEMIGNGRHSRNSANSRSFDEVVKPPARKPYMNPGAIDSHRSEFAVIASDVEPGVEEEEEETDAYEVNEIDQEQDEPQYANIGPAAAQAVREELLRDSLLSYSNHGDSPIPPYMPLQQPVSRKSTSLEKRIKKKKEKEGCKQQ